MKYCIYYKLTEPDAKFTKREHIIPAGLGGITKLPLGYVSDKANELFSPVEMKVLRSSFLSINRNNFGPGKRGKLDVKKIKNPIIRLLKDKELEGNYKLGFIYMGKSYIIKQILLDFNDKDGYFIPKYYAQTSDTSDLQKNKEIIISFRECFIKFLMNKNRVFNLVNMPFKTDKHFINIGYYDGKWFAASSHKVINMDYLAFLLIKDLKEEQLQYKELQLTPPNILFEYINQLDMSDSLYLIYAKTAFNTLAFFKGQELICKDIFNDIRKSILENENIDDYILKDKQLYNSVKEVYKLIPEKAHFIIVRSILNSIVAYVSFYKEFPIIIKLTDYYEDEPFSDVLVCDWKIRKEYTLNKLINYL